ncbi:unnamed protein product, partial [Symbiodinium sp. KB8]
MGMLSHCFCCRAGALAETQEWEAVERHAKLVISHGRKRMAANRRAHKRRLQALARMEALKKAQEGEEAAPAEPPAASSLPEEPPQPDVLEPFLTGGEGYATLVWRGYLLLGTAYEKQDRPSRALNAFILAAKTNTEDAAAANKVRSLIAAMQGEDSDAKVGDIEDI